MPSLAWIDDAIKELLAYGTSEGVTKSWETRARGLKEGPQGKVNTPDGKKGFFDPEKGGLLFHGTNTPGRKLAPGELYTAVDYDETAAFARGEIPGTGGTGRTPATMMYQAKPGKIMDIGDEINDAIENGDDFKEIYDKARSEGARYVQFHHPSSVNDGDFPVVVSLYPHEDLKSKGGWRLNAAGVMEAVGQEAEYPADHLAAMRVPKGGSNCEKCEYLKDAEKRICGNEYFIAWEGPNKPAGSNKIPLPIDEYCSDWFEIGKKAEAADLDLDAAIKELLSYGTSEGVKKAWDTRGRGGKENSIEALRVSAGVDHIKQGFAGFIFPDGKSIQGVTHGSLVERAGYSYSEIPYFLKDHGAIRTLHDAGEVTFQALGKPTPEQWDEMQSLGAGKKVFWDIGRRNHGNGTMDDLLKEVYAYGTSEGVTKAWDTRGRGTHELEMVKDVHKMTDEDASSLGSWRKAFNRLTYGAMPAALKRTMRQAANIADWVRDDWNEEKRGSRTDKPSVFFAVKTGNGIVGIINIQEGGTSGYSHVSSLATRPDVISHNIEERGVGTRLMLQAAKFAAARGHGLDLTSLNGAEGFYSKLGMHEEPGHNDMKEFHWTPDEVKEFAKGTIQ